MREDLPAHPQSLEQRAGDSRLLSRLYREIGLAAVAAELKVPAPALDPEVAQALEREQATAPLANRGELAA